MTNDPQSPTVTLIMVMSANGVVARQQIENAFEWSSEADKTQFLERTRNIGTAIMGSNTYRAIGCQPYEDVDFYVLTRHSGHFAPHERVTFVTGDITGIYNRWREQGLKQIALLGGPMTNRLFFEHDLVDEIFLTLEPTLLPKGLHLVDDLNRQVPLRLNQMETLNEQKTLLLHYFVIKGADAGNR